MLTSTSLFSSKLLEPTSRPLTRSKQKLDLNEADKGLSPSKSCQASESCELVYNGASIWFWVLSLGLFAMPQKKEIPSATSEVMNMIRNSTLNLAKDLRTESDMMKEKSRFNELQDDQLQVFPREQPTHYK
ncbi:hypothetical protein VNO78_14716 [Psophocarpus tetragonolobus]|uniref:Uncharacterized protein n=1 Tax=Psophocarpus tetragonolobus TaxID=3891 RepID=A0AAN9SF33_PSOTE